MSDWLIVLLVPMFFQARARNNKENGGPRCSCSITCSRDFYSSSDVYNFFSCRNSDSSVVEADSFQVFHFRVIDFSPVASCTIDFSELNVAECCHRSIEVVVQPRPCCEVC